MNKHDLARVFNEIGLLLELKGENPFKSRAYFSAARVLESLSEDLETLIRQDRLGEIPGFGTAIVNKTKEWYQNGTIEYYDNLKAATPPGLLELLRIPGLGPKKISQLYSSLQITNLNELQRACEANLLVGLPGFGIKTQEKIRAGILFIKEHRGEFLWAEVRPVAERLLEALLQDPGVSTAEVGGSFRRHKEVLKDLDIVVAATEPQVVIDRFAHLPKITEVIASGATFCSTRIQNGMQLDLRAVLPRQFPHALQHFTGSKEHNTALRHLAKGLGYKVNEYGLFREDGSQTIQPVYCRDEAEIYKILGLAYIPPELREDLGELEAAKIGRIPILAEPKDIKGVFHVHTGYSDGSASLREMVQAAIARGYRYMGIADHSRSASYARGLPVAMVNRQWDEIDQLNRELTNFRIFKGVESDILVDGSLDYEPDLLAGFDFVIGSIHSQFQMGREQMTARILKAMDNPFLTMLGHPTGRILLERSGYDLDLGAIIARAKMRGVILEFNSSRYRVDLDWRWCRKAKEAGVLIAVNPDAHSAAELDLLADGIAIARKGWLSAADIFNTRNCDEAVHYFAERAYTRSSS